MSNSNIHGIGDNSNGNNDPYSQDDSTPLFYKIQYKGDPREQSIPNFIKQTICPFFRFKSFSFIIIIVNVVIFIATLFPHGLEQHSLDKYFLPPSQQTLHEVGDLDGVKIRSKFIHAYRWISGNLLHAYFSHILFNSFAILVIGTMLEYLIGTWRYIVIYCISGILGSLFSVLVDFYTRSVGASICICGLITAEIGYYIINWGALPRIFGTQNRCCLIMIPIVIAFMCIPIFYNSSGSGVDDSSNINMYGHLGGLIFGFFSSFIFIKPTDESDTCCLTYKFLFYCGIVICAGFALIGFPCFYLLDEYKA